MSAANYPRCLANTLREEGDWSNHPSDPGGPTMRGIIQREYTKYRAGKGLPNQSVRYITEVELQEIYAGNYWKPMLGDLWPKGPDQIVFDIAVNSGTGRAPQIMRAAMGNPTGGVATLAKLATQSRDQAGIVKRACARRASKSSPRCRSGSGGRTPRGSTCATTARSWSSTAKSHSSARRTSSARTPTAA